MPREESALEKLQRIQRQGAAASMPAPALPQNLPSHAQNGSTGTGKKVVGAVAVAALAAWKFKALLLLVLTKLKFLLVGLKFTKFLTTGFSMLAAVWAYSLFYGWPFAALFVVLILIHELGHGAAARMVGLPVGAPVFIPFFGAFIALKERPRSTYEDFIIGAGGPIAGSIAATLCITVGGQLDAYWGGLLRAAGYYALILNLFNLMPVWSLDGARMMEPVPVSRGIAGVAFLVVVLFFFGSTAGFVNPIAIIVVAVAAFRVGSRWLKNRQAPQEKAAIVQLQAAAALPVAEATVTDDQRSTAALTYFALTASLIAAIHVLHGVLPQIPSR